MNLLDANLTQSAPKDVIGAPSRVSFAHGYQSAVLSVLCGFDYLLQMEKGLPDTVNLDDSTVWRQKKVQAKAVQFFAILAGQSPKADLIRIGFSELVQSQKIETGDKGNLFNRFVREGYTPATARAQSSQIKTLFLNMKVITKKGEQLYVVNPISLIYEKALEAFGDSQIARSVS